MTTFAVVSRGAGALGRQGPAWEVAQAANFLLSHRAGYITGQTLIIDSGLTAPHDRP